jgi:hypothetical protein
MTRDMGLSHKNNAAGITAYGTEVIVTPPEAEMGSRAIVKAYPVRATLGMRRPTGELQTFPTAQSTNSVMEYTET